MAYGAVALVVLTIAAWQLNELTLKLLPGAIALLVIYSYTKRFTWLSHWVLGATDGLAPAGAWVAVRAAVDPPAWLLWLAVTFWIAGFDLIYACQDIEFDRDGSLSEEYDTVEKLQKVFATAMPKADKAALLKVAESTIKQLGEL